MFLLVAARQGTPLTFRLSRASLTHKDPENETSFRLFAVLAAMAVAGVLFGRLAVGEEILVAASEEPTNLLPDGPGPINLAAPPADPVVAMPWQKGPPLPGHSLEGYGGGAITPMACLVNPAPPGCIFGDPAVSLTYVNLCRANMDSLVIIENLFDRLEVGYAADRLGLGTLPSAIIQSPLHADIETSDIWLHNLNIRYLVVKENDCWGNIPLPAVVVGIDCKFNESISQINALLGGALTGIGYRRASGQDYTVTATKKFPTGAFGAR